MPGASAKRRELEVHWTSQARQDREFWGKHDRRTLVRIEKLIADIQEHPFVGVGKPEKPGITGWGQVNGWRGETDTVENMRKRVQYDMHYIHNWSLALDLKIVTLTIVRGFVSPGAC